MTSSSQWERWEGIFAAVEAPFAFVDLDAMGRNAHGMLGRAGGKPIRVASKSLRARAMIDRILARGDGFRGLMTFTLPETLWLHELGYENLLLAYPSADREALRALAALEVERAPIVMIDAVEQLDLIDASAEAAPGARAPVRVAIELDMAYWIAGGRVRIGAKRSPVRTPEQAAALARAIVVREGFELAGVMGYEGHVAGLGDDPPQRARGAVIRHIQRRSIAEIAARRAACVAAVHAVAPVELVNAGGTGSLESSSREASVTELTAGSGFYAPALFDHYAGFTLEPAALFALPIVRRPSSKVATALGGGYLASGAADQLRLPVPHAPEGLKLDSMEGAGEVQTPLLGAAAERLRIGDRVYMRHSKAGELCERFDRLHLVENGSIVDVVPTYRGEGRCFL